MKSIKILAFAITAYVGIVATIGAAVAYFQPTMPGVLLLTTTDAEGETYDRLLGRAEIDGVLYLVSNSWLRRWYHRAIAHPNVEVTMDGGRLAFTAVQLGATEHQRLVEKYPMPTWMKILAGFPPRRFLRLDPLPMKNIQEELQNDA